MSPAANASGLSWEPPTAPGAIFDATTESGPRSGRLTSMLMMSPESTVEVPGSACAVPATAKQKSAT